MRQEPEAAQRRAAKLHTGLARHWAQKGAKARAAFSASGNKARSRPLIARLLERIDFTDDCWWFNRDKRGKYGTLGGDYAHRVSWRLFVGEIPKGRWVLHKCDNKKCVRPKHLYIGTPTENLLDRYRNRPFGERGS